eukprot:m.82594 g.82594  ORF g.82594 m.82594 type:complete len:385 (+) comp12877_c0_seq1:77-1231(+)
MFSKMNVIGFAMIMLTATTMVASHEMCLPTRTGAELLKSRNLTMEGKVVVITGATSGIGYGIATALASAGAKLVMLGYTPDKSKQAAANITAATGNKDIHVISPFDLSSFKSIDATIKQVTSMVDKIDVLVCDAGLDSENQYTKNITDDGYEITFQVTFLGHVKLTEALMPQLKKANGRVVNTGSVTNMALNTSYSITIPDGQNMCDFQGQSSNCTEVDVVKQVMKQKGGNAYSGVGNSWYSLFFKTFYTQDFMRRSDTEGVAMYTGHPGLVETAQSGDFSNKTVVKQLCEFSGWTLCNCVSDPSLNFDLEICPLNRLDGSATLAWLAAADKEDIEKGTDTRFFSLCVPLGYPGNQYTTYAMTRGEELAASYAADLTALWHSWI